MLRVLVILPFYGGSLPIGRYAADGLRQSGCLVECFEAPGFFPVLDSLKGLKIGADRQEGLQNTYLQFVSQAILAKAEAFVPDLILALAQAPLTPLALKKLRAMNIPTAMWFVEDFNLFTYWRAFAPLYDLFAVIQKEPFLTELADIGVGNAVYLPLAAQPEIHKPLCLTPAEKKEFGSEISFMGAGYPNRRTAFQAFAGQDFKIWGTEWEDDPVLEPLVQRHGTRISTEDSVRIFNATAINLNLHSSVDPNRLAAGGDFVNPRTFEIAACGAFQLVDPRGLMDEMFAPDELARFDSLPDLLEKIDHYRFRPEERAEFAEKGRARVLADHTYQQRMNALLEFARERLPGFGQPKPVDWPEELPEKARLEAEGLIRDLGLPASVSFEDLVTAIRGRADRLSETETALLFLDEWKKLYM